MGGGKGSWLPQAILSAATLGADLEAREPLPPLPPVFRSPSAPPSSFPRGSFPLPHVLYQTDQQVVSALTELSKLLPGDLFGEFKSPLLSFSTGLDEHGNIYIGVV